MEGVKRTFIAIKIEPGEHLLDLLSRCREELSGEKIRWVHPDNIHITLKFLGETPVEKIPGITGVIGQVGLKHGSFNLTFKGLGVFRNLQHPRVLWVGIEPGPAMPRIKRDMDHGLQPFGFEPENRDFRPHLTLGRIKYVRDTAGLEGLLGQYREMEFQVYRVDQLILYESILKPSGPEDVVLSSAPLN
jgi:2'-5' RNA ligase